MRRRELIARLGTLAAASAVAGCLGSPGGPPGTDPPATATPKPTASPAPVTPAEPSFEVTDRSCGTGRNAATVAFEGEGVTVDGVIGGRDTCDTARLADASLTDGVLTVVVEVVEEPHTATVACAQCITDIAYAFRTSVPVGELTVRVVHRSADGEETVATATRP